MMGATRRLGFLFCYAIARASIVTNRVGVEGDIS